MKRILHLFAVILTSFLLYGCDNSGNEMPQPEVPKMQDEVTYTDTSCDIVVIGAGGAGLSAATQAASDGAHVIVLEKQGIIGGNTNYSTGGLNAAETSVQKEQGIIDSKKSHYDDTMTGGYNLNDPSLVETLVNKAAAAVEWLISLGADMSNVGQMAGSSHRKLFS